VPVGRPKQTIDDDKKEKALRATWQGMIRRCKDRRFPAYANYGARGIKVCPEWKLFRTFCRDMKASWFQGATIERKDNNGNYEPGNCRWATRKEQNRNSRHNRMWEFEGVIMCISEWAENIGISGSVVRSRLCRGYTEYEALFTPLGKRKAKA
jgi:hypothetical protein